MPADHPLRYELTNELHARPAMAVEPGTRIFHLALLSGENSGDQEYAALLSLCDRFGISRPPEQASHFTGDFPTFRLKWERHTEFTTYTVFAPVNEAADFTVPARELLPQDWIDALPGQTMVAVQLVVTKGDPLAPLASRYANSFATDALCGTVTCEDAAAVWCDFRLHSDGTSRILLTVSGTIDPRQCGRLVQRMIEIETYRTFAMLAFPAARAMAPAISDMERRLTQITATLHALSSGEGDRNLLGDLTTLAAELESLGAEHSYRLSAARAYSAIVDDRIFALREKRISSIRTFRGFMDRRLVPAMRTCDSISARLERLSERVGRAANLLRTRVDVELEEQNRDLLISMEQRARLQLRLQQTVEGLSVIAISYYAVGLLNIVWKSLAQWLPVKSGTATALTIPVVIFLVWMIIHRMKRRLGLSEK